MNRILVVQTAFIGDVILATPIHEKLHSFFPFATIDFMLRKGNEAMLQNHPFLNELIIWDKKHDKIKNLLQLIGQIREKKYDLLVNVHRFASSGLLSLLSGAKIKVGFDKNPFSFCYDVRVRHQLGNNTHEVSRNLSLIEKFTDDSMVRPKLYPSLSDYEAIRNYAHPDDYTGRYITMAPTSVWFTKQLPARQWIKLINKQESGMRIFLLGAPGDRDACERIQKGSGNRFVVNLAGKLSFLQSAALMKTAHMNYVNDSAPLHMASAMNAPVTAIFCSTIPAFGFGPLSDQQSIIQVKEELPCRPCGIHGFKSCPKGHFKCGEDITF